jgi:hypothetical protein
MSNRQDRLRWSRSYRFVTTFGRSCPYLNGRKHIARRTLVTPIVNREPLSLAVDSATTEEDVLHVQVAVARL